VGKPLLEGVWGPRRRPRARTQVSRSLAARECLSLALVLEDSRDNCCVQCDQVNDLLNLVAELKEEVER